MGMIDRLIDATRFLVSLSQEIDHLKDEVLETRRDLEEVRRSVQAVSDRVTRLEIQREADRVEWESRFAQLVAEVKQTLASFETRLPVSKPLAPRRRKKR